MATRAPRDDIADPGLAGAGSARIEWADGDMPVLRSIRARFAAERPLAGTRVAACLHVTAETANLIRTLLAGGAEVALCASNPLSTQDDVAAALVAVHGAEVHAIQGEDTETYYRHIERVVDTAPRLTLDDGADITGFIHARRPEDLGRILGGTEDTTSGVIRLRALEGQERLGYPIIAVNEARTTHLFDNRYGTGQSVLDGILRATNVLLAGRTVVVFGYGRCGRGVATRARGAGAEVVVCEVDPVRALEARMDGLRVLPGLDAARAGDVLVTATGGRDVVGARHLDVLKSGVLLANAGHFDVEIDVRALAARSVARRVVRPGVEQFELDDGRVVNLLGAGRVVNLACAEGHPASVMDISFAAQALAAEHLVRQGADLPRRVLPVPDALDREIARLKLASLNVAIDALTPEQEAYLHSWELGT